VAIIGPVMMAALLEWFLWLAAFIYCLYKVYVKADHWSIKVLAVIMALAFTALRYPFPSGHHASPACAVLELTRIYCLGVFSFR
jgi:hypothetical protein